MDNTVNYKDYVFANVGRVALYSTELTIVG